MTKKAAKQSVMKFQTELERLSKSGESSVRRWAQANPDTLRPAYLVLILNQAWELLEKRAVRDIEARKKMLVSMQPRQRRIANVADKSKTLEGLLKSEWKSPSRREDWPEIRKKLAEKLKRKGLSPEQIKMGLATLQSLSAKSLSKAAGDFLDGSVQHLDFLAERHLACLMGATLALAVARFNKVLKSPKPLPMPSAKSMASLESELLTNEQKIWQALRDGDLTLADQAAQSLAEWASKLLLDEMTANAAALVKKREADSSNQEDGLLALQIGDLIRSLLLAVALGKRVAWLAGWGPLLDPARQWLKAATNLDFMPIYQAPSEVSIAALAADASLFDGKAVSVRGVMGPVTIVHRARKVISSAPILDPDGKSILVVLPYIKLDSGGLVRGAYAKISGVWQTDSKEAQSPALQIGRRSFDQESKKSWLAWSEMSLRSIIQVVPHQLSAGWSWESGPDGASNGLRYGIWFIKQEVQ